MTLTVRLDPATASALERHCARRGVTKSSVVQESLAIYLLASAVPQVGGIVKAPVHANHKAFADAGLIGAEALGGSSATKAGVRERAMRRVRGHSAP